ncbi:MAG: SAM-dependent methyltransferase [Acidimicrobiales bacterium]
MAARFGPVRFDRVMEMALYDPANGFYETGGRAGGAGGAFITSPEIGPLFGAVMARALDSWWDEAGRPVPWVVVEAGAGRGTLAASIVASNPDCGGALRYVLVERSAALRSQQAARLALEPPAQALGPGRVARDSGCHQPSQSGPVVTSLAGLPAPGTAHVVLANELLDNMPVRVLERVGTAGRWAELHVSANLAEVLLPAESNAAGAADRFAPDAPVGARIPWARSAVAWLDQALAVLNSRPDPDDDQEQSIPGRLAIIDYASTTPEMAVRPQDHWMRTYRAHRPGHGPLASLGTVDITYDVPSDQLAAWRSPLRNRSQADFLADHGIDALKEDARAAWYRGAAHPDLATLAARSRLAEAQALVDPAGLGAFRVLEWLGPPPAG